MERIGLIGMGLMGQAFIKNLHKSNFVVQGFDIDAERMDQLAEAGGVPVDTPAAVARDVKCVIISLPTSDITQELLLGGGGAALGGREDYIFAILRHRFRNIQSQITQP